MKKRFTLSVFTAHKAGLVHRVTTIFTRRKVNIESIIASESEVKGIYRFTIVVEQTEDLVQKIAKQLEKQIEIYKAFYHTEEEVIFQEIALYKVPTVAFAEGVAVEKLVRSHHARVLTVEKEFTVIEKTGHKEETQRLFDELEPHGILEFARSGRVAISKPMKQLQEYLHELEESANECA